MEYSNFLYFVLSKHSELTRSNGALHCARLSAGLIYLTVQNAASGTKLDQSKDHWITGISHVRITSSVTTGSVEVEDFIKDITILATQHDSNEAFSY